ncbi:PKD domain-containing protein, partial [Streptomyces sp. 2-6]
DITGYFTSVGEGASHVNLGPKRVMDTRTGLGVPKAPLGAKGVVTLQVAGVDGVPAEGVTAVVLNVTAANVTGTSYVSVYPDGTTRTSASNLNVVKGQVVPNLVVVPVVNGRVSFYNNAAGLDLIADITGYFRK